MFHVTMICDFQDPRARGKQPCLSRCNRNPVGEGRTIDEAAIAVRREGGHAGWFRRQFNGHRMGNACPVCAALLDGDKRNGRLPKCSAR